LLFGQNPAEILGACNACALCVRVKRCDNLVGHISNEDISHAINDIAPLPVGRRRIQSCEMH
jgi:hypothetical protein